MIRLLLAVTFLFCATSAVFSAPPPDEVFRPWKSKTKKILESNGKDVLQDFGSKIAICSCFLSKSGKVSRVNLVRTSGVDKLDKAAVNLVRKCNQFPPYPYQRFSKSGFWIVVGKGKAYISPGKAVKRFPNYEAARTQIQDWCELSKGKIVRARFDLTDLKAYDALKNSKKAIVCKLTLKYGGYVQTAEVLESAGNKYCDETAINLIKLAEPFRIPPSDLVAQRGLRVIFSKGDIKIELAESI